MPNKISYISQGKGDIVLILHGWGQTKEMMLPLVDELKYRYKCIIIDMPGFGQSMFNGEKNIDEYTEVIREFLMKEKIKPKYIIGHSFGGKVAVNYYLKYGEISKIILMGSPVLKPRRTIKYFFKIIRNKILKKIFKTYKQRGSKDYNQCSIEMKKFFVNVVNTHYNKQIKNIRIPILLYWGDKDKAVPISKAKKLNKLLENSKLEIVKGTHFAYLENIYYTNMVIQAFLRG